MVGAVCYPKRVMCERWPGNLVRILKDPALAATIGVQARVRIEEAYTQRQQFAAIQSLLERAAQG